MRASTAPMNIEAPEGILLTFQSLDVAADCFFVFLAPVDDGTRYMTMEKARDDFGLGYKSFLCEWTPDGTHLNHGGRIYDDKAGFLKDLNHVLEEIVNPHN